MASLKYCFSFALGLLCLSCLPSVLAQKPADYHFETVADCPSNVVYDVLVDTRGFVWIGYNLGIARYDGLSFTTFHHPQQSSLSMVNLREDRQGRIWCKNPSGQVFYIVNEQMKMMEHPDVPCEIRSFVLSGGEFVANSNKGLFIHDLKTGAHKLITHTAEDIPLDLVSGIMYATDHQEVFFLLHNDGHCRVGIYAHGRCRLLETKLADRYSHIIVADNNKLLLNDKDHGVATLFSLSGGQLKKEKDIDLPGNNTYALCSKVDRTIWLHTGTLSKKLHHPGKEIDGLSLNTLIKDQAGNLWASSLKYGLLVKRQSPAWKLIKRHPAANYIRYMTLWNNQVLTSLNFGGFFRSNPEDFPNLSPGKKIYSEMGYGGKPVRGKQLLIYRLPGAVMMDKDYEVTREYPSFTSCAINMEGTFFLIGNELGIIAIPQEDTIAPDNKAFRLIKANFSYNKGQNKWVNERLQQRVRALAYDTLNNLLYAGFNNGLYAYHEHGLQEITFHGRPIYAYTIKQYGNLSYIATVSNGILMAVNGKVIKQLDFKQGLLSSSVVDLFRFGNHLWILGTQGIQLFDLDKKAFDHTIPTPPLKGTEVFGVMELNGYVYLSTAEGLYQIPLHHADSQSKALPRNYLLSVIAGTDDTLQSGVKLSHKDSRLQFNLAGLYFQNPNAVYFKYRLMNSKTDTGWEYTPPGQHKIIFPYIMPGQYTFEAIAKTTTGLTAAQPISFSFEIKEPLWKQTWFILAAIAVIVTIAYVFISIYIQNKKSAHRLVVQELNHKSQLLQYESKRLHYENAINESELKALKSQMNPHFIANSLNAIQDMFLFGNKSKANEQLSNFAILTRAILTISGKKSIPLSTELMLLKRYLSLEEMRFHDNFEYELTVDPDIDEGYIQIPPMIIQPFVENAIKHGLLHKEGFKKLTISFFPGPDEEYILCRIRDNGIGRTRAKEKILSLKQDHNSFSTEAIKKQLLLICPGLAHKEIITFTDLQDDKGNPTGTSVAITIPVII